MRPFWQTSQNSHHITEHFLLDAAHLEKLTDFITENVSSSTKDLLAKGRGCAF